MSERKNLDKLFQEKFKDFEPTTPEDSWPYIEEKLKEKKKRRVIPIWWKLSGVAAALLIGFSLSDTLFNDSEHVAPRRSEANGANGVVVRDRQNASTFRGADSVSKAKSNAVQNAATERHAIATTRKGNAVQKNAGAEASQTSVNSGIAAQETVSDHQKSNNFNKKISTRKQPKSDSRIYQKESRLVVNDDASLKSKTNNASRGNDRDDAENINKTFNNNLKLKSASANNSQIAIGTPRKTKIKSRHLKASQTVDANDPLQNASVQKNHKVDLLKSDDHDSKIASQHTGQNANLKLRTPDDQSAQPPANGKQADPILEKTTGQLAQTENKKPVKQEKKLDSAAIATVEPNALEKLLHEKENNLVAKEPHINRWQITSSVAPIYFGSTSNGSPIDSAFAGNSKTYKTNMSVRLGVNYAVNKKLTIRAGVSQVTLDYNTRDVLVYAGMQRNSLGNVDTNSQNQFLHFARKSARTSATAAGAASGETNLATDEFASELNQRMGYIEVPLELSYAVVNKKFGLNVIGGISTLFLNENKITVLSDGLITNLGEANNLSKTHFSTNVGLGARYRFYKAFQFNFEPMFKYQINTFSKDNGNFKPYFLGLYTGVSYSF